MVTPLEGCMGSDIIPIRPGLEIHNEAHSELVHLYDRLSPKKQDKIRDILQQLVNMEQKVVEPPSDVDIHNQQAGYFLQRDREHLLYCVPIGQGTRLVDGGLVLVPNGEKANMQPGARALRVEIKDGRFCLGADSDFRNRAPGEPVLAVASGHYVRF